MDNYLRKFAAKSFYVILGSAIGLGIFLLGKFGLKESHSKFVIAIVFFACLYYSHRNKYIKQISSFVLGLLIVLSGNLISHLIASFQTIPVWDFMCFYMFGKAGLSGSNFYDPALFSNIFTALNLKIDGNAGFIAEIVNVGFWYPPPSMFLFLFLGLFKIGTSYIIWQSILFLFLIIDLVLLFKYYRLELNDGNKNIYIFSLAGVILLFPGFISSFEISQTVFIFLFFLLLLINNLNNWKAGLFLALLIIIKPLAAVFALYFVIFKKWKIFTSFLLTGSIIIGISILFFGFDSFLIFFKSPPTNRIPPEVFYEGTNQSLNAVLLRLQLKFFGYVDFKTIKIVAYSLSLFISLITIYCSFLISKSDSKLAFMIFLPMALLVYPNTLVSYTIIVLPIILYFFNKNYLENWALNVFAIFFLFGIGYFSFFLLNLILWAIFIALSMLSKYNFSKTGFGSFNFTGRYKTHFS